MLIKDNLLLNFQVYTLDESDYYYYGTIFSIFLTFVSLFGYFYYGPNTRSFGWLITLINSFVMSVIAIVYFSLRLYQYPSLFLLDKNIPLALFQSRDNISGICSVWFGLCNFFDLLVGTFFYRKYVDPLSGYVHHSVFIWLMFLSNSKNGFFLQSNDYFSAVLVLGCLIEIPTFLLALGSVFPKLRTDIGFGITFFIFRLCYHGYMGYYCYVLGGETILVTVFALTTLLHTFWFSSWIKNFEKYRYKKNKIQ